MRDFDSSYARSISRSRGLPIAELILDTSYKVLRYPVTLLGISPISEHIVRAGLLAAKECHGPIMLIASLNQVDFDGGYTGWTPESFIDFLCKEANRIGVTSPIIVALDHCGPWLKDLHVKENYGLEEAMEAARKSIESALAAGFDAIHIDATVDPFLGDVPAELAARRTLDLLEFAEETRRELGLPPINYEVGSDRWKYGDVGHTGKLISQIMEGLEERKLDNARILFMVGDVGTKIARGNLLNVGKARRLMGVASKHGLYLKTHSTDYVENPQVFPELGIGGANIGPMYADMEYKVVRRLALKEEELVERGVIDKPSGIMDLLHDAIIEDGRWRKYVKGSLESLSQDEKDLVLGLCSRYVWARVDSVLSKLFENLSRAGVDGESLLLEEVKKSMARYMKSFNLCGLDTRLRGAPQP